MANRVPKMANVARWAKGDAMRACLLGLILLGGAGCARHRQEVLPPVSQPRLPDASPLGWPLEHDSVLVTSRFGEPRSGGRTHRGIDLAVPRGTPVKATASGATSFSGPLGNYGNFILLRHARDIETAYGHLDRLLVRTGERVRRGQVIGTVGATGNATGPHLHYEVRIEGVPVNPERWLYRGIN